MCHVLVCDQKQYSNRSDQSALAELAEVVLCCEIELILRERSFAPPAPTTAETFGVVPVDVRFWTPKFSGAANELLEISTQRIKQNRNILKLLALTNNF